MGEATTPATAGERTRERILEAALPLFAEDGFAGTSVRAVGRAAAVNVATLAYHFDDKEGLYRACIEAVYEELATIDISPAVAAADDPIDGVAHEAWTWASQHRTAIRLLHRQMLDRGRHHDVFTERWIDPLTQRADPLFDLVRPDWPAVERRLLLFAAMHLLVRFVLDDPTQLAASLGIAREEVDDRVVRFLATLVKARLAVP